MYQTREQKLYLHSAGNVCVRLRKKADQVIVFWMSGIYAGNKEKVNQGRFTQEFRKIDPKKDTQILNDVRVKQRQLYQIGKNFKVWLQGGDRDQKLDIETKKTLN